MGKKLALVDRTPGLTRDRREGLTHLFDIPIRVVDTAGFEETVGQTDAMLKHRSLNRKMLQDMLVQTRNALIYSDLALFVLDSREGITYNDVALYKWLNYHKLRLPQHKMKEAS
jgi:GTP-binding protein